MPDKILLKRSSVVGVVPRTSSLDIGELGLNTADGKAYFRKSGSAGDVITSFVVTNSDTTGSITILGTGSFDYVVITGSLTQGSNLASGLVSHAQGSNTTASGNYSHAEGNSTTASGAHSHAEGNYTVASGLQSHAEGLGARATYIGAHAEGGEAVASGHASHAEGIFTSASGYAAHAEGWGTLAAGTGSHTEGYTTTASGDHSHAEGNNSSAAGEYSHAEGQYTSASGRSSHAEGLLTAATWIGSHAEGSVTVASAYASHAEGWYTSASGHNSHAEGTQTIASATGSHAEGNNTLASGQYSHAEGLGTSASGDYQHVEGRYNVPISTALWIVGDGTSSADRKNLITAYPNNLTVSGALNVTGAFYAPLVDISGSLKVTGSTSITGTLYMSYPSGTLPALTNSVNIFGTASNAVSASRATYAENGGAPTVGPRIPDSASISGSLWWNTDDGNLYIQITEPSGTTWVPATSTVAGGNYGATSEFAFTSAATWSVQHNFGTTTPIVQVYTGSEMMVPSSIRAVDSGSLEILFAQATAGTVKVSTGVGGPTSASFAITAADLILARTASYANDTAAASAGIPMYGVYRNGGDLKVRVS